MCQVPKILIKQAKKICQVNTQKMQIFAGKLITQIGIKCSSKLNKEKIMEGCEDNAKFMKVNN